MMIMTIMATMAVNILVSKEQEGQGYTFFFKSEATAANLMVKHQTLFPLNEVLTIIAANQNVSEVSEQCH